MKRFGITLGGRSEYTQRVKLRLRGTPVQDYLGDTRRVVYSVRTRRHWLHYLRTVQGQDRWIEDYSVRDPGLTLDWGML